MYGVIFILAIVVLSIKTQRSFLFTMVFGLIFGILGIVFGYIVTIIIYSKEGKSFLRLKKDSINERELILPILSAYIFWQLTQYFIGDILIITRLIGLLIGWFIGHWLVRLLRKLKKKG